LHLNAFLVLSGRSGHCSNVSLEVASTWSVNSLNLDSITGGLFEEVEELKGLHLVLTQSAFEGQRALRGWRQAFEHELVVEVTKDGVLQTHLSLALGDHQWQVSDLELSRLVGLEDLCLGMDLHILILDGELGAVYLNFLVCWVLNDHLVGDTLTNRACKFNCLHFWVVLHSHLESVEEVLT
jgi:hypothetical protein